MKSQRHQDGVSVASVAELERLLRLLAATAFLVFFQAFMVAPLIPRLADLFDASTNVVGLAVPAYLLPYGVMQLVWGPLSDRVGRGLLIVGSLVAFIVLTALTAAVGGADGFLAVRSITALGASALVPISLALVGDLFHYSRRGHALGWLFGAMAGGMAFGSTAGALLEPIVGWALHDGSGKEYTASLVTCQDGDHEPLKPGRTVHARPVFQIPGSASGLTFVYSSPADTNGADIIVDLGE